MKDHPHKSSTYLAPNVVIIILLTIFPMLDCTPCDYPATTNLSFLIPLTFPTQPPNLLSPGNHQFGLRIYKVFFSVLLVYFVL